MLNEQWLDIDGDKLYCLSTQLEPTKKTVVFIHGLGESHLCFVDALDYLPQYNLVMFDMCGYGYSPASNTSHTTEFQALRVLKALDLLEVKQCILIGHSWGGDIGTLVCHLDNQNRIGGFINAEGGLHEESIILSKIISDKYRSSDKSEFKSWVHGSGFAEQFSLSWGHSAGVKYLSSLRRCSPIVLGETASEIYEQHKTLDSRGVVQWGQIYESLRLPKCYYWGTASLEGCGDALKFITSLENKPFQDENHWVQNNAALFYQEVDTFICCLE
ncbi:alpha/beta fold hydrolase [Aliivibrio fischeri]|uniref:alpha/beta fold hydrolase n=1 Tax=Aliivibrio fischeri TaxID=668 RepID=UPI0009080140|nr:alpha/beta fold hydrolase [Aliivibrio fischeri]